MNQFGCKNIVFSSSATVYGNPQYLPLDENHATGNCTNPYGKTKHMIEEMMRDLSASDSVSIFVTFSLALVSHLLRYSTVVYGDFFRNGNALFYDISIRWELIHPEESVKIPVGFQIILCHSFHKWLSELGNFY